VNYSRDGICAWKVLTSSDGSLCHRFFWVTQLVYDTQLYVNRYPTGSSTRRGRQGSSASQNATAAVSVPPVAAAQSSEDTASASITTPALENKPEVVVYLCNIVCCL
jgi:hypothetical protein